MTNHISLPVSELKSALPGFSKIIGRRTTLPVLGCLKIERNNEGEVNLQATNLDDTATFRVKEVTEGDPITCLVSMEPLARIVKGASNKDHIVLVDEGKKGLKLRSFLGGNQIDQPLERFDLKEWPPSPNITSTAVKLDQGFGEAFRQAFECASDDSSRYLLNGVCLDVSDKKAHYVVSTNTRVLFSANSFAFDLPKSIVIPSHRFLGWNGWMETDECWFSYQPGKNKDGGWIQLKNGSWTVITREVEGQYPNWRNIIPANSPKLTIQLNESAVKTLLEVLPKLPGEQEKNSPVGLRVQGARLLIEAKSKESDKPSVIPIPDATVAGKDMMVRVNRHYLIRALKYGLTEITHSDPTGEAVPVLVCQSSSRKLMIAVLGEFKDQPQPASSAATTETKEPTNNERTDMRRTTAPSPIETNRETNGEHNDAGQSSIKAVAQQIEKIKDTLKGVVNEFGDVLASLKTVEKEKKATEKEIESIRSTLRSLQKVQI